MEWREGEVSDKARVSSDYRKVKEATMTVEREHSQRTNTWEHKNRTFVL